VNDVHWACALAHSMGRSELSAMVPMVVRNVRCAVVLSDILRRCCCVVAGVGHTTIDGRPPIDPLTSADGTPLAQLLEAAISAFVATAHSRLSSISPRHYAEFIDFLAKAKETFLMAGSEGRVRFAQLVDNMRVAYRGKKKLVSLITARFGAIN